METIDSAEKMGQPAMVSSPPQQKPRLCIMVRDLESHPPGAHLLHIDHEGDDSDGKMRARVGAVISRFLEG